MFDRILIANRNEIARRIARSAKKLGLSVVAVCSEADKDAPFAREADESVVVGPPPPKESYLNIEAILAAAKKTGAKAIHPGYGFLSENAAFAEACADAGIVFIGPTPLAMRRMGSKIEAKETMKKAGVPVVPGSEGAVPTVEDAVRVADHIGYPVMLKASAGGGGIGMSLCKNEKKLREAFDDAQKKGAQFFGSSELLLEKFIESPHHVEVQVLGDTHGNLVHLFDRECSVQRRNQKVVEEARSPFLKEAARAALLEAGVKAARAVDYVSAGTIEFVADAHENVFFLEMNTRLQVEHPVTECITGVDIVEQQLRIAAGEKLPFTQADVKARGHAIEVRLCAEDPDKRFFPSPGTIESIRFGEAEGVRTDSGVVSGSVISPFYDSLFAKVIAHGDTREQAIDRLDAALAATEVTGIRSNLALHRRVLNDAVFRSGTYNTGFLADVLGVKS